MATEEKKPVTAAGGKPAGSKPKPKTKGSSKGGKAKPRE